MQGVRTNGRQKIISVIFTLVFILLISVDQLVKTYFKVYETNNPEWTKTEIIKGFFYFTYTFNTGAAWSFLNDVSWAQTFFKILTVVALVLFFIFYAYSINKKITLLRVALTLIICGTIGNFIDRIAYNGVVDFIGFTFGSYNFPIFNLADSYMTVGVILLLIHYLFIDKNAIFRKNGNK